MQTDSVLCEVETEFLSTSIYLFNKPSITTQRFLTLHVSAHVQAIIRLVHYLEHMNENIPSSIDLGKMSHPLNITAMKKINILYFVRCASRNVYSYVTKTNLMHYLS